MSTRDSALLAELVELFGDADHIRISPSELREAVSTFPASNSERLIKECQCLISELLRYGIWFQLRGKEWVHLQRTSSIFRSDYTYGISDFEAASAYAHGDQQVR